MMCVGCPAEFEPGRKNQRFCSQACGRTYRQRETYRANREEYNARARKRRKKRAALGKTAGGTALDGVDPLLYALEHSEQRPSGPMVLFCSAMIWQAIADFRGKGLDAGERKREKSYREAARLWLMGSKDSELEPPFRAAVCFEQAGLDQAATLEAIGVVEKKSDWGLNWKPEWCDVSPDIEV